MYVIFFKNGFKKDNKRLWLMANHNLIRLGLVKEITKERSEEVRDSLGGVWGRMPQAEISVQRLCFFVLSYVDVGNQSAVAIFWGYPFTSEF